MKKGQNTARVLLASALSVLLSIAMLTATTFAWFVDGVNNTNNEIHTGNMDVRFFGARYQVDESGQVKWGTINNLSRDALISVNDMEPGDYGAAVIAVSNLYNDISADVEVSFTVTDASLSDVLWYSLTPFTSSQALPERAGVNDKLQFSDPNARPASDNSQVHNMQQLAAEKSSLNFPADSGEKYGYFLLEYGMYTDADMTSYQGKSFAMNFMLEATQATGEKDGFNNDQYDAQAKVQIKNEADLKDALSQAQDGDVLTLSGEIVLSGPLSIKNNVTLEGNGEAVLKGQSVYVNAQEVTFKGITFESPENESNNASSIYVTDPKTEKLVVDGCEFRNVDWDCIQLTSKNIKEVVLTNNRFENTEQGTRYVHLELRDEGSFVSAPEAKWILTGNTFVNVSKKYVSDSAITVVGFLFDNMTISGNKFEGAGADALDTNILWVCNGIDFSDMLPVSAFTN
ncbi:hypothetical protein [uncultured Ruthenibacterium sp.]|uniref:hypothetical protein n=1 Tax=uncultured Ruthenibacterium sp. TaxID=1905347 RepID=UPI00349EBC47